MKSNAAIVSAPGKPKDGITARVPAVIAAGIGAEAFEWMVPGLLKEKIAALIKGLPKAFRRKLVPVAQTVETIAAEMPATTETSLKTALSRFIDQRFGVHIPAAAWTDSEIPDHLRMRIALTDTNGRIVKSSRDPAILNNIRHANSSSDDFEAARKQWEQGPVASWDIGDLPDTIRLTGKRGGSWTAYPSLELRKDKIVLHSLCATGTGVQSPPPGRPVLVSATFCQRHQIFEEESGPATRLRCPRTILWWTQRIGKAAHCPGHR